MSNSIRGNTNSPDTRKNRLKTFQSEQQIMTYIDRSPNEFPEDITFNKLGDEHYILASDSQGFARISIIDLTVKQLSSFVKHLANYLAQPIQKDWDGVTVKEIIAA